MTEEMLEDPMSDDARAPKRTEKLQLMLDPEELQAIDDWRFENRLPSRAAAIRSPSAASSARPL